VEAYIPHAGRAIQGATSHSLGQNFSKKEMFDISFEGMYVCMYVWMCVYVWLCLCMYVFRYVMCACMYTCMCLFMSVFMYVCMYVCMYGTVSIERALQLFVSDKILYYRVKCGEIYVGDIYVHNSSCCIQ
jgi:hypothetical protein